MILYQKQKIENAVAYFASEYYRRKGYPLTQTWIYKFLALLDFRILKKTGTPCLGLEYRAMEKGPVPILLYRDVQKKTKKNQAYAGERFVFRPEPGGKISVLSTQEADLDFFSDLEFDEMNTILEEGTKDSSNLDSLIDKAHEEIRAWDVAWKKAVAAHQKAMPMDYADEFEQITDKSEAELTPEEDRFLCRRGMLIKEKEAFTHSA
jgi:hypothetical protein